MNPSGDSRVKTIEAFPLSWPHGWKRTEKRKRSAFRTTFARSRDDLFRNLKLMGVNNWNVILSTNIPLRRDGLPYAGQANPQDPGVAIYFKHKSKDMVFACDTYHDVTDNVWAVCKTIEAIRGIQRWGASDMMERAFTGFTALPAARGTSWWEILGISRHSTLTEANDAWKKLAKHHHPDKGGSQEKMYEINRAWHEAEKELKA